jgi:HK97 family phage major capsid protein
MTSRDALRARLRTITEEMSALGRHERPTRTQEARFVDLEADFANVSKLIADADREALRSLVESGNYTVEAGTIPAEDLANPRAETHQSQVRGRALDLLTRAENTSDLGRARLDKAAEWVERDETPDDAMARWVLAAGDENYRSAFGKLLRNPTLGQYEWNDRERAAFARAQQYTRAMTIGTDSAGGYLVPLTLDPSILLQNTGTSNTRLTDAFTVKTIATDAWVGTTSAGVTAEWAAEAAEVADASPTLAQVTIPVHRGDAFVPFSFEAQGDIRGLEAELAPLLADAKERLEATAFITGTGTGQPTGLITAAVAAGGSTIVASTTADTYVVGDVYKVKTALPARYRANAAWLANEDIYDLTRQFATGTGPQSAFWADFGDGTPARLLGKPVYETSEMDGTVTASATNYILVYGSLKEAYYAVRRVGATVELVPHLFGPTARRPTGQRGLLLWFRTGGALVNSAAIRVLNA